MLLKTFDSIYFNNNKFIREIKKYRREKVSHKVVFFPYRLFEYSTGLKNRKILIDTASLLHISDTANIIFLIRNDYLKRRMTYINIHEEEVLPESDITNEEIIDILIALQHEIDITLNNLEEYTYEYSKQLSRFNLNRILLGPLQRKGEINSLEGKVKERSRILFLKSILEDGLGLRDPIDSISFKYILIYAPLLLMKSDEKIDIIDTYGKLRKNKNLLFLYEKDPSFEKWINNILI